MQVFSTHYSLVTRLREIVTKKNTNTKLPSQTAESSGPQPGKLHKEMKATFNIIKTAK